MAPKGLRKTVDKWLEVLAKLDDAVERGIIEEGDGYELYDKIDGVIDRLPKDQEKIIPLDEQERALIAGL